MCRNIKRLRQPDRGATDEEIRDAALQFVRKVSGYRVPAKRNEVTYYEAVEKIASATRTLLDSLVTRG